MSCRKPVSPPDSVQFYRRTLPTTCTAFSSSEGKRIFREALDNGNMENYFGLAAQFRTQDEPAFCGLSTLVMVLNTLEVDPKRVWKGPWRWYHENMLDCCVTLEIAAKDGINLDELACLASCNTLSVNMVRMDKSITEEQFRQTVKTVSKRNDEVIVVSYSRSVLQQTGDGHFSPLAGYHEEMDLVLILDTARFKYPPHWVHVGLLYKAMQACDKSTGLPRGFLKLKKSDNVPLVLFRLGEGFSSLLIPNLKATNKVGEFVKSWELWLNKTPDDDSQITTAATHAFIQALMTLEESDSILSTQVDITCPGNVSDIHGCVIHELVTSLESLPLYELVTKVSKDYPDIPCFKGNTFRKGTCGFNLLPSHFLTVLLAAWPTFQCNVSRCNAIRIVIQSQLYKTSSVLQDEIAQLSRQLDSILDYTGTCACRDGKCN